MRATLFILACLVVIAASEWAELDFEEDGEISQLMLTRNEKTIMACIAKKVKADPTIEASVVTCKKTMKTFNTVVSCIRNIPKLNWRPLKSCFA
jgi:hypothetical protein